MRRPALLPVAALLLCSAHVGDNNTHYRGPAGPYTVQVVVRHPGVVPGLAGITVRVEEGDVAAVSVRLVRWDLGLAGSPSPDRAEPVPGQPGLYAAELWFMTTGSYSVHVMVDGERGSGTAVVPVSSLATEQRAMPAGLGLLLIGLAALLVTGLLTIVAAALREAAVPPGEPPPPVRVRRSRRAVAVAAVAIALVLFGARAWWRAEAAAYANILFEPTELLAEVRTDAGGRRTIEFMIRYPERFLRGWSAIVPDHGKLVHMFMVREPGMDAFAHVHPVRTAPARFALVAPPLPPGSYRVYADVIHESGFAQTLLGTVELPDAGAPMPTARATRADAESVQPDPDDSWWTAAGTSRAGADTAVFDDGASMRWVRPAEPIVAGASLSLRFEASTASGSAASLEPYMGMLAHAAVRRDDGAVFVHLHPTGSFSTTSQARLVQAASTGATGSAGAGPGRASRSSTDGRDLTMPAALSMDPRGAAHDAMGADPAGTVVLPYAFPRPGNYRIWVQVRIDERVRTASFDLVVQDGAVAAR